MIYRVVTHTMETKTEYTLNKDDMLAAFKKYLTETMGYDWPFGGLAVRWKIEEDGPVSVTLVITSWEPVEEKDDA